MTVTLRRYYVPSGNGLEGWGIFVIGSDGYFSAVSDFGNYAFRWAHHGESDFRTFLIRLAESPGYVCSKLSRCDWYDAEASANSIRAHILLLRRYGRLTKDQARDEWRLLDDADDVRSPADFGRWYEQTTLADAYEFYRQDFPPDVKAFAERLWPRLADVLKAELAVEAEATGS